MAKLSIKKLPQTTGVCMSDYAIEVDGREVSLLTSLSLSMNALEINEATITFLVEDVEVDAEALTALEAIIQKENAQ